MNNSEQPAFAQSRMNPDNFTGLTKREYFAATAMQGMLASGRKDGTPVISTEILANQCILFADKLLKQLSTEQPKQA